jgi:hypothetical protein
MSELVQNHEWLGAPPLQIVINSVDVDAPRLLRVVARTLQPMLTHVVDCASLVDDAATAVEMLGHLVKVDLCLHNLGECRCRNPFLNELQVATKGFTQLLDSVSIDVLINMHSPVIYHLLDIDVVSCKT